MRYSQWKDLPAVPSGSLVLSILAARGMNSKKELERFFTFPLSCLHDPFLLADMQRAVDRIEMAIQAGEKLAVYGDYDVDGVTAVCLLTHYLRSRGADCTYFIPHRTKQGYGLHTSALRELADSGVTLVITVDVGVTAFEAAVAARDMKLDLVITDHHSCRDTLPDAVAVVNPQRRDSMYPYVKLAGVGVAFKLVCALDGREHTKKLVQTYGDLVALGTVADIMPLDGENRVLVRHGLGTLKSRLGTAMLLDESGAGGKPVTTTTIAYSLAPLLNAAGRLKNAGLALELLLTEDPVRAKELAELLMELNSERRMIEAQMHEQALEMSAVCDGSPALILAREGWHQGVTGILASKLLDKYGIPVFLISIDGGTAKGTARAPKGMDLTALLEQCSGYLVTYGGHSSAAGFVVDPSGIDAFTNAMQDAVRGLEFVPQEEPVVIDACVSPDEITRRNAESIAEMEPFGLANPEPVLRLNGAVIKQITPLKEGKHLRLLVSADGRSFSAICFGFEYDSFPFVTGDTVDLAFHMSLNHYRGEATVQLELVDIR